MLTNKTIVNKFYLYKTKIVKVKKIHKAAGSVSIRYIDDDSLEVIPLSGSEILLTRLYTIGELAKIIEKRTDTLRKYEKKGLVLRPDIFIELDNPYKNWRFYNESEVYDVIAFFSGRTPGRPVVTNKSNIKANLGLLRKKVENI